MVLIASRSVSVYPMVADVCKWPLVYNYNWMKGERVRCECEEGGVIREVGRGGGKS